MEGLGKLGGFLEINIGITLVVSFRILPLVLGGQGCGISKRQ